MVYLFFDDVVVPAMKLMDAMRRLQGARRPDRFVARAAARIAKR